MLPCPSQAFQAPCYAACTNSGDQQDSFFLNSMAGAQPCKIHFQTECPSGQGPSANVLKLASKLGQTLGGIILLADESVLPHPVAQPRLNDFASTVQAQPVKEDARARSFTSRDLPFEFHSSTSGQSLSNQRHNLQARCYVLLQRTMGCQDCHMIAIMSRLFASGSTLQEKAGHGHIQSSASQSPRHRQIDCPCEDAGLTCTHQCIEGLQS